MTEVTEMVLNGRVIGSDLGKANTLLPFTMTLEWLSKENREFPVAQTSH